MPDAADSFSDIFGAALPIAAHHGAAQKHHLALSYVDQEITLMASCDLVVLSS
jgi:hypothetical protein